jgi:hypothetical protein
VTCKRACLGEALRPPIVWAGAAAAPCFLPTPRPTWTPSQPARPGSCGRAAGARAAARSGRGRRRSRSRAGRRGARPGGRSPSHTPVLWRVPRVKREGRRRRAGARPGTGQAGTRLCAEAREAAAARGRTLPTLMSGTPPARQQGSHRAPPARPPGPQRPQTPTRQTRTCAPPPRQRGQSAGPRRTCPGGMRAAAAGRAAGRGGRLSLRTGEREQPHAPAPGSIA